LCGAIARQPGSKKRKVNTKVYGEMVSWADPRCKKRCGEKKKSEKGELAYQAIIDS
jgi:hypothetical protein